MKEYWMKKLSPIIGNYGVTTDQLIEADRRIYKKSKDDEGNGSQEIATENVRCLILYQCGVRHRLPHTLLLPTVLGWKMDGWGFLGPMPTEVVMAADAIYRLCYLFGLYFAMYDDI